MPFLTGIVELRPVSHLARHLTALEFVAMVFYRRHWLSTWLWLLAGWLIDLDHLLAYPDYAPERCSIGSHPLHTPPTIAIYGLFVFPRRSRLLGLGLLIHTGLDAFDCLLM